MLHVQRTTFLHPFGQFVLSLLSLHLTEHISSHLRQSNTSHRLDTFVILLTPFLWQGRAKCLLRLNILLIGTTKSGFGDQIFMKINLAPMSVAIFLVRLFDCSCKRLVSIWCHKVQYIPSFYASVIVCIPCFSLYGLVQPLLHLFVTLLSYVCIWRLSDRL